MLFSLVFITTICTYYFSYLSSQNSLSTFLCSFDMQNSTLWVFFAIFSFIRKMYYSLGQIALRSEEAKLIILSCYSNHNVVENYVYFFFKLIKDHSKNDQMMILLRCQGFFLIVLHKIQVQRRSCLKKLLSFLPSLRFFLFKYCFTDVIDAYSILT